MATTRKLGLKTDGMNSHFNDVKLLKTNNFIINLGIAAHAMDGNAGEKVFMV